MPLLDHFREEIEIEIPWPTMATAWTVTMMGWLNRTLPRDEYHALLNFRLDCHVERSVTVYPRDDDGEPRPDAVLSAAPMSSVSPLPLIIPTFFPDDIEVEVYARESGRPLVGVIALVSPNNKDDRKARDAFVAKCVTYLSRGIGLVVVDVVTNRLENLHNKLLGVLSDSTAELMKECPTYVVGYRPVHRRKTRANEIEIWPYEAVIGQPVPSVPLGLRGGPVVLLDLETTYRKAIEATGL